ncbi:helix-turn-helix domain-containing protein [Empedobacter falsenii]
MFDKSLKYGVFGFNEAIDLQNDSVGCYVFLITNGYAEMLVNGNKKILKTNTLAVLFYNDHWNWVYNSKHFSARYVKLTYAEVEDAIYRITSPTFWDIVLFHSIFYPNSTAVKLLNSWFDSLEWISAQVDNRDKIELLKSSIYTLFLALNIEFEKLSVVEIYTKRNQSWILGIRFLNLLNEYKDTERSVQFYASKMNITTTYLNKVTHKVLRASPKELIDKQIISDIKHYLLYSNLTLKEISENLNYEDVSYLSRFFKKHTGLTTKEFKNS